MLVHTQFFIHDYPLVLLCRAALSPLIAQPVFMFGITSTQLQDLSPSLLELHEVNVDPLIKPVQILLNSIPSFYCVSSTTQLGVICRLTEDAFSSTMSLLKDIKWHWSHSRPLRDITQG